MSWLEWDERVLNTAGSLLLKYLKPKIQSYLIPDNFVWDFGLFSGNVAKIKSVNKIHPTNSIIMHAIPKFILPLDKID